MKNNKSNKKMIIKIIIILLVVVIALSGLLSFMKKANTEEERRKREYGYETMSATEHANYVPEKKIKNSNISVLSKLKGELPISTVVSKVKTVFVDVLPGVIDEIKNYDDAKLKEYYATNKNKIKSKLRIDSEESFLNMAHQMTKMTSKLDKDYKACDYTNEDGLGFTFSYENGEKITCKIIGENSNTVIFEF